MNVYIPKGQASEYKTIEEAAEKAEFMAMVEQLTKAQQKNLLWRIRFMRLTGKIKRIFGVAE